MEKRVAKKFKKDMTFKNGVYRLINDDFLFKFVDS